MKLQITVNFVTLNSFDLINFLLTNGLCEKLCNLQFFDDLIYCLKTNEVQITGNFVTLNSFDLINGLCNPPFYNDLIYRLKTNKVQYTGNFVTLNSIDLINFLRTNRVCEILCNP